MIAHRDVLRVDLPGVDGLKEFDSLRRFSGVGRRTDIRTGVFRDAISSEREQCNQHETNRCKPIFSIHGRTERGGE